MPCEIGGNCQRLARETFYIHFHVEFWALTPILTY